MKKPDMTNWTAAEVQEYEKARTGRLVGVGVLVFFGAIVAGFVTPLILFLARIATGG